MIAWKESTIRQLTVNYSDISDMYTFVNIAHWHGNKKPIHILQLQESIDHQPA